VITSTANPRLSEARKLQRGRERRRQGRVLIEGVRLVRDALEAGTVVLQLFYVPERAAAQSALAAVVALAGEHGAELLACTEAVFATLSDTVTPQGVAAVVRLPDLAWPTPPAPLLVLDCVRDPGNAGTLLRTAEAAGVAGVVFGPETVDPYNDKVLRGAMGAHFRVPVRVATDWETIAAWLAPEQSVYVAEASASLLYDEVDWRNAALVVGGEAEGASEAARSRAVPVAIPMVGRVESLNAAVAGAIMLFEAARQRRRFQPTAAPVGPR
jgi:TrmH family RNA methyltransferase